MSEQGPGQRETLCQQHLLGGCSEGMQVESLSGTESLPAGTVGTHRSAACQMYVFLDFIGAIPVRNRAGVPWSFSLSAGLRVSAAAASAQKGAESLGKVPPPGGSGALPLAGG